MISLHWRISSAERTKDIAIQSAPWSNAKFKLSKSSSVNEGIDTFVLGRLTPLRDVKIPPCTTSQVTVSTWLVLTTRNCNLPSSNRMISPAFTSRSEEHTSELQ